MTPETIEIVSFLVGRDIKSVRDLTPIEIEALLNNYQRACARLDRIKEAMK